MMIGDTKDYVKLVPMVKEKKPLEVPPSQFILGATKEGDDDVDDLADDTQICSCHNVSKGDVAKGIRDGSFKSIGDVKSNTKAGTGCGGCIPLVQSIFNKEMKAMGAEVLNHSESAQIEEVWNADKVEFVLILHILELISSTLCTLRSSRTSLQ
jgi:nitrite reductase (NAD(P)H)